MALNWFLSFVNLSMVPQRAGTFKTHTTLVTFDWSLPSVVSFVDYKAAIMAVSLPTLFTAMQFLPCVCNFVGF